MNSEPMEVDGNNAIITDDNTSIDLVKYDVKSFKLELEKTVTYLTNLCEVWENKLTDTLQCPKFDANDEKSLEKFNEIVGINEVKEGEIRVMIGKAHIILGKKGRLQQFRDLVRNCELGLGEKVTNCSDLQGFWEMVTFHIDEIKKGFLQLSKLEENGWKRFDGDSEMRFQPNKKDSDSKCKSRLAHPKNKGALAVKKASITKDRKPSAGIREMMAAKRREMAGNNTDVPITTCASTNFAPNIVVGPNQAENDDRVFDGGFFNISSPSNTRRLKCVTPQSSEGRKLEIESLSAPSSTASTPVRATAQSLRRSLLVESASKSKSRLSGTRSVTSFAIVKVNSQIRRSISQVDTPRLEPVFKKLRSRTIVEHSKSTE